eukprot:TRINITY_DN11932_c0_g1_i7.p2 TRINITY_DN11932_c0_g1~~TRINITY_DN11932_c0_g1_i7.p2  ORF type:complete len:109 (+),score=8.83 TRINITY_DN11932_c0_g1_i7:576-902(+)
MDRGTCVFAIVAVDNFVGVELREPDGEGVVDLEAVVADFAGVGVREAGGEGVADLETVGVDVFRMLGIEDGEGVVRLFFLFPLVSSLSSSYSSSLSLFFQESARKFFR